MSRTKRKDYLTGRMVNDGKQVQTTPGEVTADNGVYKRNGLFMDFGGADRPRNKRMQKNRSHRAIRRDGNELIRRQNEKDKA